MTPTRTIAFGLVATLLSGAAAFAQADKTVRIVLNEELDVVEPCMAARSNVGRVILQNVNESLTEFVPGESDLKPRLATEWEQVDADTWRFKLREGVKFHDGSTFDPADVAFTLDRIKTPEFACEVGTKYFGDVDFEVAAIDDTTVEITTKPGTPILPLLLSTVPIQPSETSKAEFTTKPIGTGPLCLRHLGRRPADRPEAQPRLLGRAAGGRGGGLCIPRRPGGRRGDGRDRRGRHRAEPRGAGRDESGD